MRTPSPLARREADTRIEELTEVARAVAHGTCADPDKGDARPGPSVALQECLADAEVAGGLPCGKQMVVHWESSLRD